LISVHGLATPSYRTDVATNPQILVLATNQRIAARPATYAELATGDLDCRLVKVIGRVRSANIEKHQYSSFLHLDVSVHGGELDVYQPLPSLAQDEIESLGRLETLPLLDSTVEIEAVAAGAIDGKSRMTGVILYVQQKSAIRIVKKSQHDALKLPVSTIDTILQSRHVEDKSARLRLRGALTYYKKGEWAVLEQEGKSIFLQTREIKDIPLGEVVDALGLASEYNGSPSLREALLFDTHTRQDIKPMPVSFDDAISGLHSDNLVSMKGLLVSQLRGTDAETLVINANGNFVTGRLEGKTSLPRIRVGTKLRLTGICKSVGGSSWNTQNVFQIEMRSPDDIAILASPSWWTFRRLVQLLGTLGTLAFAMSTWAILLRRRVRQQTEKLNLSMMIARTRGVLLETISVHKTAESLLKEFCHQVQILLPGTTCHFRVGEEDEGRSSASTAHKSRTLLHQASLRDTEGHAVGHLEIFSQDPYIFGAYQQDVCHMLAQVANVALQQSLLFQSLVYHSTHDPLTDLPNRRLCDQRLQEALEQAVELNGSVTVAFIDINRFKDVNDRYGHKTGDWYLKHISSRLRSAIRSVDTLARVGGDEFLVIIPQKCTEADFISVQERLHACFEQPFEIDGYTFKGSASIGTASFPQHGTTAEELNRHADQSMYVAKRGAPLIQHPPVVSPSEPPASSECEVALNDRNFVYRMKRASFGPVGATDLEGGFCGYPLSKQVESAGRVTYKGVETEQSDFRLP
jgi:diguanylate cyclase (GGDEF)-like protein